MPVVPDNVRIIIWICSGVREATSAARLAAEMGCCGGIGGAIVTVGGLNTGAVIGKLGKDVGGMSGADVTIGGTCGGASLPLVKTQIPIM